MNRWAERQIDIAKREDDVKEDREGERKKERMNKPHCLLPHRQANCSRTWLHSTLLSHHLYKTTFPPRKAQPRSHRAFASEKPTQPFPEPQLEPGSALSLGSYVSHRHQTIRQGRAARCWKREKGRFSKTKGGKKNTRAGNKTQAHF